MRICFLLSLVFFGAVSNSYSAPQFWNSEVEPTYTSELKLFEVYDESVNFQPGLNLYPEAGTLTDLFGTKGSQLCAPVAITHAFNFLKNSRQPNFPQLASVPDLDQDGTSDSYRDQIRHFFNICGTDREEGTRYQETIGCMKSFIENSGYNSWAYIIGPHARYASPGNDLSAFQRAIAIDHIRYYVGSQAAVIMGVGWYVFNSTTQMWERSGGHFFNIYGYDFNASWANEKVVLKAVNSWIDYTGRDQASMYDDVVMTHVTGAQYPSQIEFELSGPGFTFNGYKALAEDIFVMLPYL